MLCVAKYNKKQCVVEKKLSNQKLFPTNLFMLNTFAALYERT